MIAIEVNLVGAKGPITVTGEQEEIDKVAQWFYNAHPHNVLLLNNKLLIQKQHVTYMTVRKA